MRLWHYKLLPVLPRKQLISQLRECVLIGKNLFEKGTPNHIIVNRVIPFYPDEFAKYCKLLVNEIRKRRYNVAEKTVDKLSHYCKQNIERLVISKDEELFSGFHNDRYLRHCFNNLEEKYDCGIVPEDEWKKLESWYSSYLLRGA